MNYSGNIPDWHQYNPPQSGINDVTSTAQNVNSGHLSFISSISPTQLNGLSLTSEGHEKHQNDSNYNPRHFQPPHLSGNISHGHNAADNTPLASMVQMQNCIGHYGPSNTRNPMVDNLNGGPMDPRSTAIGGLNEELGYRNNQVPLNGPISHLNGPNVMNMNATHGSMGPRNTNVNSHATSRAAAQAPPPPPPPSFVPCKGLCCNPDPNMGYQQWEKYCSYQNNATYRENVRSTGYQTDARRFGSESFNFRKDNFDGKEVIPPPMVPNAPNASDHRRNFPDFKYRKDRLLSRSSYPPSSGMLQGYPMQNYNYTGDYQKYPYNVKEYSKVNNNMNIPNQGMVKHQEQGFVAQQKYNNKQVPYQNSGMIPNSVPASTNVNPTIITSAQNSYFNPQYPRNLSMEASQDCQETSDNVSMVNRMQTSTMHAPHSRYQMYHQKIAMQRFSMENHLRELTRIPGYQSHPKYKECVLRYKEILKLQQSVTYQGQIPQQTSPQCVTASTANNASIPSINLQFDQNGVLINSNYMPDAFPRVQQTLNSQAPVDSVDKQNKQEGNNNIPEMVSHSAQKSEQQQLIPQQPQQQHDGRAIALCTDNLQKQDPRYPMQKNLNQSQFGAQKMGNENFNNLSTSGATAMQQKISKEFADKPELDVRQFLANWDESEDEDGAGSNMPNVVISDSTPVVVVGYENVDLSAKALESLEGSKPEEIRTNVIAFESQDKGGTVVPAQDCLTISYSSAENVEIAKETCKGIAKEGSIVQPGSIIQCISNGPDEVPTIHIVDNLEISSILQVTGGQVAETLETRDVPSFFHESAEVVADASTTVEIDKLKKNDSGESTTEAYSAENLSKKEYTVGSPCPPKKTVESTTSQTSRMNAVQQEISALPTTAKSNLESAQDINLKKQSSFTSEESHNPDDISLPDLPTSECTPISTTLNTPIHSDSEESSERVEDLAISTNPIEVIQNSPVISFTQSPTRGEPYDHLSNDVKSKSANSLESQYQTESRFKSDGGNNNVLRHNAVLGTFEFSTNADKSKATTAVENNKGSSTSPNGNAVSPDGETQSAQTTGMRITLTSEAGGRSAVSDSTELDRALQNITNGNMDSIEGNGGKVDINYAETYEARMTKMSKNEGKSYALLTVNEKKSISNEMTSRNTMTTSTSSSSMNDTVSRNSKAVESNNCSSKIAKGNSSTLYAKHSTLTNHKRRKSETLAVNRGASAKEDSVSERNTFGDDKSLKVDTKNLKNSQQINRLMDHKRSASSNQTNSRNKRHDLSESTAEKYNETIIHHDKHIHEVAAHKSKSCAVESLKGSVVSQSESKVVDKDVNESRERIRLLKEYRRIKYKSHGAADAQNKDKDQKEQEASDCKASKKCHVPSNPDERSVSQLLNDKQLCQRDAKLKLSEEHERRKHAIRKTFVSKNINPDFAIQVTNVNLKLKDNDNQKESQNSVEEAKNGAIKIEINVSCSERNTTEKLLHENIKNAVAETIGHLTSSISNGARSNPASLTEIQCDKKVACDDADSRESASDDCCSSAVMETATSYNEVSKEHPSNEEVVKHKSTVTACKEDARTVDEASNSFTSKKRRNSSTETKLINDVYEVDGMSLNVASHTKPPDSDITKVSRNDILLDDHVNHEAKSASAILETPKSDHVPIRRKSVHQDADRKIIANSCVSIEESKIPPDNSPYAGSTSRNVNIQRKERPEITSGTFISKNARNLQDNVVSKLNIGPSTSSATADLDLENPGYDYNHFDVAPNENADVDDRRADKWKRLKKDDGKFSNFDLYETASGYVNPIFFSVDEMENLNTVPVYTTKDGKITYSPNPRFTYRELIIEARTKEGYSSMREPYFVRSPSFDYYNCSKLRKVFKRNRDGSSVGRKREADSVDTKSQYVATKHIDYLPNKNIVHKNVHCAKSRSTPHLEFFNDDADKLYTNGSNQQESKEDNRKNIVDLSFLEKQYNPESECTPNIKHCKTKILTNSLEYEKGYNESSVFDTNLFLGPKASCWEETMESVKSYSSHIDRRNSDNFKELNFSKIFAAQKPLNPFSFLPAEYVGSSNGNGEHKKHTNCNKTANESTFPRTLCSSYIDDPHLIRAGESRCEQPDTIKSNEQENGSDNKNDVSAPDIDNRKVIDNKSASIHNASLHDEYTEKRQTQPDEIDSSMIIRNTEKTRSCSPEVTDEKMQVLEKSQSCTNCAKDKETEHLGEDDARAACTVHSNGNKFDTEDASAKVISDKDSVEVASPSRVNTDLKDLCDEPEYTVTTEKASVFALNKQDDEKDNLSFSVDDEIIYEQVSSLLTDRKDEEEQVTEPATEPGVSTEIYFEDINAKSDTHDRENSIICKEKEPISPEPPKTASISRYEEESNEQKLQELQEDERPLAEDLLKDQGNDRVDDCGRAITSIKPTAALNLHPVHPDENTCDIFTGEKHEQNISEFTVIKSIIKADKKQYDEPEAREGLKDCDSIIDSKLLCMDSTDCGIIYAEDRCTLAQISDHDFTEDSMVPMEWETSQIQEDAVNHLCSIDESSIDFASAANSLQDNSLLDNLSLSHVAVKEPSRASSEAILEAASKIESKPSEPVVESAPVIEEYKTTSYNDEKNKEQSQVSSSNYEKLTYLRATDCNANTKMVPKLVIKKTETCSKFVTKLNSNSSVTDDVAGKFAFGLTCQPKIPKMIIRNARSRPGTPSIEAVPEEVSVQANIPDRTTHNVTREELCEDNSESSMQGPSSHRNKIPKMKIKLDEKHSNKIMRAEDTAELYVKRKNMKKTIPKVKIKNSSRADLSDDSICKSTISQESKDPGWYEEKIPVLKLKKQERNGSTSPEVMRKRTNSRDSDVPMKKCKKFERDETGYSTRHGNSVDLTQMTVPEYERKKNPLVCISEKIPKVIIKRTSASAEFKCELSKGCKNVIANSAKWQPEVKLERYRILDSMVKDLKSSCLTSISRRIIDKIFASRKGSNCREKNDDPYKLSRSNSTSDLFPIKCKQRRMSDYDCRKTSGVRDDFGPKSLSTDSKETETCATSKKNSASSRNHGKSTVECQKDKRRSRSRDNNNSRTEIADMPSDRETDRSTVGKTSSEKIISKHDKCDTNGDFNINHEQVTEIEDESTSIKLNQMNTSDSTSFKATLKELKTTSKLETCFVKLSSLSEISSEEIDARIDKERDERRENESLSCENNVNKIVIKNERLSSPDDIDNECTMYSDTDSLKDEPATILGNFEMDSNSVIKIESSDDSQTTIEILPASPDGSELENNVVEDGDSEQLYPSDAIPTQFELELEITDNSNIDLLDVPMPKLDPIALYNSRHAPHEDYNEQASKERYNKLIEPLLRSRNSLGKDKRVEIDIGSGDDKSVLRDKLVTSVEEISSKSACSTTAGSIATKRNFCCNDSLIKEVLAAKETLKKCFSKSRYESNGQSNARPKTAAEKKQGPSFNLSETKSDDASRGCRDDITLQTGSTSAAGIRNKTENISSIEKSDKRHSKQNNKSIFAKKKTKPLEKRDEESSSALTFAEPKETIKDLHECTTISLKAFKQFGQQAAASNLTRAVNSSEKRKKSLADQSDIDARSRDSQSKKVENKTPSYKIPKISRSISQGNNVGSNAKEIKLSKEDNMPILEPEIAMNFDANSDRDSSRSPPVITNQDSGDVDATLAKLANDEIITLDKVENDVKDVHKKSEMSIADFVTQLAYHEKATIKHRRYCNLCERWFPTTSRHRRHLAGYQHRHIELTQRRSIHALFMLFTGKPCPRLLPANVARNDCSLGELTPLQIAVQDITKPLVHTQRSPKKQKDVDK